MTGATTLEAGAVVEVPVHGIAAGGAGVGRLPDGRVVFVHRTAPGERVRVRVTGLRSSWGRAAVEEVLEAAPERREAPCPHYDRCGGCTLEHLGYPAQLRAKGRIVADALSRIGGIPTEPPEVVASPSEFRYRNRITVTLLRNRGDDVVAGFHELENPGEIVDVGGECLLPEESLARTWSALRDGWGPGARRLPGGRRLRLTLRSVADGTVLVVHGGTGRGEPETLLDEVPSLVSVWRSTEEGPPEHLAGVERPVEVWRDEEVEVSGTAFLQVNGEAAGALEDHVLEACGEVSGRRVVDAYCGLGVHARRLARRGARVTGIELDPHAVAGARSGGPEGASFVEGRVEDVLEEHLPADLLLLNPPRTGLADAVAQTVSRSRLPRVVYVSCDPATLARDLGRLEGFVVEGLRSFDLFPQTAHVETVATLVPEEGGGASATS